MTDQGIHRTLVIIDDDLFEMLGALGIGKWDKLKTHIIVSVETLVQKSAKYRDVQEPALRPLAHLLAHAAAGHFYGLKTLIVFDLCAGAAKHLLSSENMESRDTAVLLDILNEKEQYPAGLEVAEVLDPTRLSGRIAWFTATASVTSEYKPYPLIAKNEIPPSSTDLDEVPSGVVPTAHGALPDYHDTVFLWWAYLFGEIGRERLGPERSAREHVEALRSARLLSRHNVETAAKDIHGRSSKRAGKGGLAGNILEEVYWQTLDEGLRENGKIREGFLKISGTDKPLDNESDFLSRPDIREALEMPAVLWTSSGCSETRAQSRVYYCMTRAPGRSLSDLSFEKIGFDETRRHLLKCVESVAGYHRQVLALQDETMNEHDVRQELRSYVAGQIKTQICKWTSGSPLFDQQTEINEGRICDEVDAAFNEVATGEICERLEIEKWRVDISRYVHQQIENRIKIWVEANPMFRALTTAPALVINNQPQYNIAVLCEEIRRGLHQGKLDRLRPKGTAEILIHGDIAAQNIFVRPVGSETEGRGISFIDPKARVQDYLIDYVKLLSTFTGQGHLEYLRQHPDSACAHFDVNEGTEPTGCFYVCSPALGDMEQCRFAIINWIEEQVCQAGAYAGIDTVASMRPRLLLRLAGQYLGAPPYRDSARFDAEMKLLYYRGVEILNEFCEIMGLLPRKERVLTKL